MKDPCKPSTSVKVLRNVVKIKTGKKTKLTKRNICEVFTDIKTGKLPLPPLVLTRDRSYLLDKKSPFTSGEYDKLFDKTSSRAVLKRLAEKVNIKKVDTLTKSQLVDAILKRLQFLNISEPVKLSAAVSSPTAAPTPKVTVITKPKQIRKGEFIPAVRKSGTMTNKDLIGAIPQNTVPTPPQVNSRVSVAPEQGKVILGDRNYDLLFDPKTKKSELIRIAKKVNVENVDNMTRKELIEATTKRLRFMTNRGLTRKAPVPFAPNKPPVTSTPSFFPKAPNRPPVTTTPSFLQVKPKAPTPDTGLLNYSRGGANAKGGSFLNFSNGGKKNTNVPNFLKKANVPNAKGGSFLNFSNGGKKNTNVPNFLKKANVPNAKGGSFLNFFGGGKKNSNTPSVPKKVNVPNFLKKANVPNVPKKVNAPNAKKGKSFLNFFGGGKKNSNTPSVPKKVNVPSVPKKVNAPNAKKGKSFLNFFRGGKKNSNAPSVPKKANVPNVPKKVNVPNVPKKANAPNAKKGKSFLNFFRGGKKNSNAPSVPKKVNAPNAKKGKSFFNYFKGGKKKNVNVKPNSGIGKNTLPPNVKPNKIENNKINNMTEELINNAVNNEISNSVRKKQLNDEAKRQNRAKNKNNNNFNATKELNKQLNNEAKRQNRAKNKNNNNFNAGTEFNKQMAIRNVTDELITRAVNNEISNSVRKKQLNNEAKRQNRAKNKNNNNFNAGTEFNKQMAIRDVTDELITRAVNDEIVNSMRKNINNTTTNTKLNNATKNMILSINKATTLKELRKIFLKGTLKLHPNKGGNEATFKIFMNAHNKKKNLLNSGNTKKNDVKINNMTEDLVNNAVNEELTTEIVNEINAGPVTDEIIDDLVSKIINETPVMRLGGRAAEPNQLTNDILTNVEQDVSKEIVTTFNNPLFNNKRTTINNPLFNNKKDGSEELSNYINNLGLQNENKQKLMSLFNTTNQTLEAAKRNATTIRDTRKLEKNANFVSERDKLRNKITKELNMVPNNNGMFSERRGLTKGRIGIWARELKQAKTMENLKNIDNKLAKKTALRRDIENKYTKMGLTKVEKMNHRRKTMKFLNNVDARRELVEIQVKNKTNNNNNTNSVISNYNSNANSNEPKGKMKYGSRENFINAKKIELRELAKNTSTNFGRNINQMETRTNVAKLRGRIEGAVRRNKASFEPVMTNIDRIKRAGAVAEAKRKAKAELRKKNKEVAKATGRGVKATQKKRQMKRK
jgi:hypothetical protein